MRSSTLAIPEGARGTGTIVHPPTTAEVVRALSETLPLNEFGLPDGIYRHDMLIMRTPSALPDASSSFESREDEDRGSLPANLGERPSQTLDADADADAKGLDESPTQSIESLVPAPTTELTELDFVEKSSLRAAYVPLSYFEGFPTLPSGQPFWNRLEFEPPEDYKAFWDYLESGKEGARQLFVLSDVIDRPLQELQELYHLYYWRFRVRAYELFRHAEARYMRHRRALALEDRHYLMAERMLDIADTYIQSDEFAELLTPKSAIELVKAATALQRIASGLAPQGGASGKGQVGANGAPVLGPVEVSLHATHITQAGPDANGGLGGANGGGHGGPAESDPQRAFKAVLSNPKTAQLAQELVISITSRAQPVQSQPGDDAVVVGAQPLGDEDDS